MKKIGDLIVEDVKIKDYCNSKNCGGRKFVKLSQNSQYVIKIIR